MENSAIKEKVYGFYNEGFHCAESIINTIKDLHPTESDYSCKIASGFCGGIGRCHQDICGALAGGVMALGNIYGRDKGGEDINKLAMLSVELREQFIRKFNSTVCKDILNSIEAKSLPGIEVCKDVTSETAIMLHHIIEKAK